MHNLLIYGANGYTGQLIVEEAVNKGLKPILGGRNKAAINALAEQYKLEARVFDLSDREAVLSNMEDIYLVIHCAGPFEYTCLPMIEACFATNTHYIDITGEIWVFEKLKSFDIDCLVEVGKDVNGDPEWAIPPGTTPIERTAFTSLSAVPGRSSDFITLCATN